MSSEITHDKFLAVYKKDIDTTQAVIECRVSREDLNLSKVLSINSSVQIDSIEALTGEATYNGKVVLEVIFMTTNNEVDSIKSTYPFNGKVDNIFIDPTIKILMTPNIIDSSIESASENEIKVICVVSSNVSLIQNQEIKVFSDEGNNFFTKSSELNTSHSVLDKTSCFEVSGETILGVAPRKILSVDADVSLKNQQLGQNYVSVSGDVILTILFIDEKEELSMSTASLIIPFKEELELDGVSKEMNAEIYAYVKKDLIQTTLNQSDSKSTLKISLPVCVHTIVYEDTKVSVIEDVYSITNQTYVVTGSFTKTEILPALNFENKIEGNIILDDSQQRIDKLICITGANILLTNNYIANNELVIQGVVYANVVYYNEEDSTINSIVTEFPYEIKEKLSDDYHNAITSVQNSLSDVSIVVKKGRDLYFDAKVKSYVNLKKDVVGAVISDLELGEELAEKSHALEIYFTKAGQTLWDIAKDLKEDINLIIEQNPELSDIMSGEEKIIIYHQREIQFS